MIYKGSIAKGSGGGSGGDVEWGDIGGSLANQTDLQTALNAKQDTLTAGTGIDITNNVISASISYDNSTINENASNKLQAIGVKEARTDTAIRFWHGTEAQYNNGESQTYYNWTHSNGSDVEGNWTDVTLPTSANWTSVCYGNGKYVAVASNSTTAIYSTNGTSWNSATLPASASWSSVCYGNGRFVAVANGSASAAYSTDGGETWIEATMPTSRKWRGVCYGNGKFIAVGNGGYYATSTDGGETWTEAQFYNGDYNTYYSIVYGNGKFVALANEANTSQVSTDGENWTNITLPGNRMTWTSVAFGAKGFVAVANYYKVGAYSADGETWEEVTLSDTINRWTSVCYGNGKFVAVSNNTDKVAVSTDGKNWSEETVAAASKSFNTITYGGGKFVTLVANSTEEYYKDSATASNSVYTTDATPTTASTVYYSTTIIADLTITAVGSDTITLSDGNTYTYDSTGDQTVTYSVGESYPNYVCNIDGVGLKIGDTDIANLVSYSAFTGATSSVAGSAGLVPAPAATDNDKYLKGDGTWATVSGGGLENTATGTGSLTILGTPTSSNESINIGTSSLASGYNAIAIGSILGDNDPTSAYNGAVAIGWSAIAYNNSIAIGELADARASTSSVVIGSEVLNGQYADHAEAGDYAVSVGAASKSDDYSVAVGANSYAMNYSIALGYGAAASQDYEFVVGGYDTQNSQTQTFTLMDLSTGKIPNDRINGATGSFTSQDGKTITVTNGVITSIV